MNRQAGFTLLETLAALALLALAAGILLGAFGQSSRALAQVARSDRLHLAALSILDAQQDQPPRTGVTTGAWGGLDWTLRTAPLPVAPGLVALWQLELDVSDGQARAQLSTVQAAWIR